MGILAMIAGLALLIVIHEAGHWLVARLLGFQTPVFSVGFGKPYIVLGRFWDTEFRLSPWLLGGYVAVPELGDESDAIEQSKQFGAELKTYTAFPIWKRAAVASAGVIFNVLAAVIFTFALFATVGQRDVQVKDVYISQLTPANTIAADAGFQADDVIQAVNGHKVADPRDLVGLIKPNAGKQITITVARPGVLAPIDLTVTPNENGQIGIAIGVHAEEIYHEKGVGEAAVDAVSFNAKAFGQMVEGIGMMVGLVDVPEGTPEGATDVHGIVAIVQIGSQAFDAGLYAFVMILVMISWNLAILNILPIPVLDGGYLLLLLVEKVRGKPISRETRGKIFQIFFMLLIALMIYALMNDILNPINFGGK